MENIEIYMDYLAHNGATFGDNGTITINDSTLNEFITETIMTLGDNWYEEFKNCKFVCVKRSNETFMFIDNIGRVEEIQSISGREKEKIVLKYNSSDLLSKYIHFKSANKNIKISFRWCRKGLITSVMLDNGSTLIKDYGHLKHANRVKLSNYINRKAIVGELDRLGFMKNEFKFFK